MLSWKFERLSSYFSKFLWVVASENSPVNKNMFKVDRKDGGTVLVNVI